MNFKQSAALGLSTLLMSGLLISLADANPMAFSKGQPSANQQLGAMLHGPLSGTLLRQMTLHPAHKSFNPLAAFSSLHLPGFGRQAAAPIAGTTPIKPVIIVKAIPVNARKANPVEIAAHPAKPVHKLTVTRKSVAQVKTRPVIQAALKPAQPLEPTVALNPALAAQPETMTLKPAATLTEETAAPAQKIVYKQVFIPKAANETAANTQAQPKANPRFESIYQTHAPAADARMIASTPKPKPQEAFQLLAASPLEQLVMQSKSANMLYAPGLDTSSPNVDTYRGNNNVKVLKSGISQKTANIDLTIGKAEVIYLSRPASRVSVSNPEVASAVVISPTQIQLVGKNVGVANLMVWGDMVSPDHTVVDISVHKDVSVLVNQLKYVDPGIQIVPMAAEDTVILTGQAENRETAQLAIEMAKAFFSKNAVGAPGNNGPNSQAPGSAIPGVSTNVINLLKVKGEPSTKIELVRQKLQQIDPNIHIEVVPGPDGNEKVILTGRVPTASIASKALNLTSVFYGQPGLKMVTAQGGNDFVRMQASSSGSSSSSSSSSSSGSSSASGSSASGGANLLQGSVITDATGNVISMLEIAQKPQIRCSIKFLELTKTSLNALGGSLSGISGNTGFASWSGVQSSAPGKSISVMSTQNPSGSGFNSSNSAGSATRRALGNAAGMNFNEVYQNGITQVFTINNAIAGAIQALQERKQVRTLAEPTLTLLSGEQGSFLAGGEIPIAFVGGQGQVSIQYKEFGIRLNLLPNVTDDGKIEMQISPEVSSLDQANGVSTNSISVPAFITRRMNTTLLMEQGQSFVLAGLYNQQDTDSMSRFPGLGSVPILGSFFRNTWNNHAKSEMVVVIRPEVIYSTTGSTGPQAAMTPSPTQTAQVSQK